MKASRPVVWYVVVIVHAPPETKKKVCAALTRDCQ
jgi:hypothetical protein